MGMRTIRNDFNNPATTQPTELSSAKQALLAKWLRKGNESGGVAENAIPRRQGSGPAPLSLEQQRLWFFNQLEPGSPLYNMPIASRLRGPLNPAALQQAMDAVVARHEALRARFVGLAAAHGAIVASRTPELPEPAIQYGDFAVWQKDFLGGKILEKEMTYWRKQLEGAPPVLELPTDYPRPVSQTFRGACEWMEFSPKLSEEIKALSQAVNFTPYMILLAAFQVLLNRY